MHLIFSKESRQHRSKEQSPDRAAEISDLASQPDAGHLGCARSQSPCHLAGGLEVLTECPGRRCAVPTSPGYFLEPATLSQTWF